MSLTIPPAKNYQSPLIPLNSVLGRDPVEGPMQVAVEFDWTTMGMQTPGTATWAIQVNLANSTTRPLSQICGIKVDNSLCGSPVTFIFTDTQETVTVDAYEPCTIVPVLSATTNFYAVASNAIAGDVTRAQLLNYVPPPVTVDPTEVANFALTTGLGAGGSSLSLQLVPAGVNGTLEDLQIGFTIPAAPTAISSGAVFVHDGQGTPAYLVNSLGVWSGPGQLPEPGKIILDLRDVRWRFQNGLVAQWTPGTWTGQAGTLNFTVAYRVP